MSTWTLKFLPGKKRKLYIVWCKETIVTKRERLSFFVFKVVCLSSASDSSETIEVTIMKLYTVTATASDMGKHHVLIIWTLIFIQGHTDLIHKNNKCSIISETVPTNVYHFAVKRVRLKVCKICSQSDDLALYSRSQLRLKLHKCLTCTVIAIYQTVFKLWHSHVESL